MSICNFYPMKKRRLCKTPNGGRPASTLGKLRKTSENLTSTAIEILWDNNSPSPTTTLALAGKRRRRLQNNQGDENNEQTDISFVVQKLSENTSPVVEKPHTTLLEMWVSEEHNYNDSEEEFTSPPCQPRHDKRNAMLATPLNQRRTTKRTARKAARQVVLVEIRKLVDELQKNDPSSCGNLTQRESQDAKEQEQPKRADCDEVVYSTATNTKQKGLPKQQTSTKIAPESNTNETERLVEDSFEWTEDDMDALILTCQLSSSGKGSLDDPGPPGPKFGFSPSSVIFVPETQGLSGDQETAGKPRDSHAQSTGHSQGAIIEDEKWEVNFGEDDSFLESAAQDFELSQENVSVDKLKRFTEIKDNDKSRSVIASREAGHCQNGSKEIDQLIQKKSSPSRFPKRHDKSPNTSSGLRHWKPSVVEYRDKKQDKSTLNQRTGTLSLNKKSNENNHSSSKVRSNFLPNSTSVSPLRSRPENSTHLGTKLDAKLQRQNIGVSSLRKNTPQAKHCSGAGSCLKDNKKAVSVDTTALSGDVEDLLSGDNFAALLEDFNFDESFSEATIPTAVPSTNKTCKTSSKTCKTSSDKALPTASSSKTQKTTYSKDQIEKKRLEAQRRRHAKLETNSSRPNTRNAKMR